MLWPEEGMNARHLVAKRNTPELPPVPTKPLVLSTQSLSNSLSDLAFL